jgi:DNA-binding phage protein
VWEVHDELEGDEPSPAESRDRLADPRDRLVELVLGVVARRREAEEVARQLEIGRVEKERALRPERADERPASKRMLSRAAFR